MSMEYGPRGAQPFYNLENNHETYSQILLEPIFRLGRELSRLSRDDEMVPYTETELKSVKRIDEILRDFKKAKHLKVRMSQVFNNVADPDFKMDDVVRRSDLEPLGVTLSCEDYRYDDYSLENYSIAINAYYLSEEGDLYINSLGIDANQLAGPTLYSHIQKDSEIYSYQEDRQPSIEDVETFAREAERIWHLSS